MGQSAITGRVCFLSQASLSDPGRSKRKGYLPCSITGSSVTMETPAPARLIFQYKSAGSAVSMQVRLLIRGWPLLSSHCAPRLSSSALIKHSPSTIKNFVFRFMKQPLIAADCQPMAHYRHGAFCAPAWRMPLTVPLLNTPATQYPQQRAISGYE